MLSISQHKQKLRTHARCILKKLSTQHKKLAGEAIAAHVENWCASHSGAINLAAIFVNFVDEICTDALDRMLIAQRISRALPYVTQQNKLKFIKIDDECLAKNRYMPHNSCYSWLLHQAQQEIDAANFDAIFVPGLAFDMLGNRLGRGMGYYDRTLSMLKKNVTKPLFIGLALDEQMVSNLPIEQHDIQMDYICTPHLGMREITSEI